MFKKRKYLLVLTLLVIFMSVVIVDAQQVSTAAKADLVDSLEDLREAMSKKIDCDINITAQAFTDVKDYWRSKRWADIFTTPLRILEDTLSVLNKITYIKNLSKGTNAALNNSETLYQFLSIVMMYQDLQKVGEKLYWGLNGPNYVASIESMLEEADATFVPPFGDNWQKYYKEAIENYLYGTTEKIPLIIPRRSTTAERKNIEFARGAIQVRSRITRTFNDLIKEIEGKELPGDFPIDEVIIQVKELTKQIHKSMSYNTDVEYKTNFQDHVKVKLGAVGEQYRVFGQVAGMVDKNLEIEQSVELLMFIESTENAALLYTTTYKIPGAEEIEITQKATVLSEIIINPYNNTFYSDSEQVFYMLPQEMILSMPTELSNLWMVADDIDQYLRCFYQEIATPIITSPLKITPSSPYYVGDTINAEFTITNKDSIPITFSALTVGGRDPDDQVADFTHRQKVTLEPSESYDYQGTLTLNKVGNYHFFCTYQIPDGDWNTSINLGSGLTDEDRVEDIEVKEKEKPTGDTNKTNIIHNLTKDTYYDIIQDALNDADSGNTIEVTDGTYDESIIFPYNKKVILQSVNGASSTTIRGDDDSPTITVSNSKSGITLEGFAITHSEKHTGSGIKLWMARNVSINNCTITGNTGSGIDFWTGRNVSINNCTITGNTGGGIYNAGTLTITDSTITGNTCGSGGGIYNTGTLTITDSTISNNTSKRGNGGGINNDCEGGIGSELGLLTINNCIISGNTAGDGGGGINNLGYIRAHVVSTLTITDSIISGNTAGDGGGGIKSDFASLTITKSAIYDNSANWGGGIDYSLGPNLTITKSAIYDNSANYNGGAINANISSDILTITSCDIFNNSAGSDGGGILIDSLETRTIGGENPSEKNTICGNNKEGEIPSIDQQIRSSSGSLYDIYKSTNHISAYCE